MTDLCYDFICFWKIQFLIFVRISTQKNIRIKAIITLIIELKIELVSVAPTNDIGPMNKTNRPPPTNIKIHILKINAKTDVFMIIQLPLKMQ
jgi:hypothetical protein